VAPVLADEPAPDPSLPVLGPVVVTATKVERPVMELPMAVTVVDRDRLAASPGRNLADELRTVPGLSLEKRSEGTDDLKLGSRGFGARATFGTRDILVLADGIPLTDLDGQTRLESADLAAVDAIEVLRGPAAGLYGPGGLAGAVNLLLKRGPEHPRLGLERTEGGLGFERTGVVIGGTTDSGLTDGLAAVSRTHERGWREHAASTGWRLTGQATSTLSDATSVHLIALASAVTLERPGPLTAAQLAADPRQPRPANLAGDWSRDERRVRVGARIAHLIRPGLEATLVSWGDARDLAQLNFQDALSQKIGGGADARLRWETAPWGHEAATTVGAAEAGHAQDEQDYKNINGFRGALAADESTTIRTQSLYAQQEIRLLPPLFLMADVRFDRDEIRLADRFLADGDQTGGRRWDHLSPAIGGMVRITPRISAYANLTSGFSTPALTELRAPLSGTRFDLEPQRAQSGEAGVRGTPWPGGWVDCGVYQTYVRGELAQTIIATKPYYRNVDRTSHAGVEAAVNQKLPAGFALAAAGTAADARFEADGTYGNNQLPGVPRLEASAEAKWQPGWGPVLAVTGRWRQHLFANDANTVRAASWRTAGVRVGWLDALWEAAAGIDNFGDARYVGSLSVNDTSGAYFEPADPRTFWVSLSAHWR